MKRSLITMLLVCLSSQLATAFELPRPTHVIIIVEENKTLAEIVGTDKAPYLAMLAAQGALFTQSRGVTHPSLPNYFALFAGILNSNGDDCPARGIDPEAPNLASELRLAQLSFVGYAEGLPSAGSMVCSAGSYARKHAPWVSFRNVPAQDSQPITSLPLAFEDLPTVSMLIPDVDDDMHDGTIESGDFWLHDHLSKLILWASQHNTLVVITWDEGYDSDNSIPTIFYGPMVKPGKYGEQINHFNVLRTIEDLYGLKPLGRSAAVAPITDCWL